MSYYEIDLNEWNTTFLHGLYTLQKDYSPTVWPPNIVIDFEPIREKGVSIDVMDLGTYVRRAWVPKSGEDIKLISPAYTEMVIYPYRILQFIYDGFFNSVGLYGKSAILFLMVYLRVFLHGYFHHVRDYDLYCKYLDDYRRFGCLRVESCKKLKTEWTREYDQVTEAGIDSVIMPVFGRLAKMFFLKQSKNGYCMPYMTRNEKFIDAILQFFHHEAGFHYQYSLHHLNHTIKDFDELVHFIACCYSDHNKFTFKVPHHNPCFRNTSYFFGGLERTM